MARVYPNRRSSRRALRTGLLVTCLARRAVEESLHREGRRAQRDRLRAELAELYRRRGERMAQRMPAGGFADLRQQPAAEQQSSPTAEDDPLRVEQVDQVGDASAQVFRGLVQQGGGGRGRGRGADQRGERGFLVIAGRWAAVSLQDRLGARIGRQAA